MGEAMDKGCSSQEKIEIGDPIHPFNELNASQCKILNHSYININKSSFLSVFYLEDVKK